MRVKAPNWKIYYYDNATKTQIQTARRRKQCYYNLMIEWFILPRNIKENKIFDESDYWYIETTQVLYYAK